ncbi:MAG: hypothetical protein L0Z62_05455 [Gemmataceae bacterium]|nr:hypothetical protein [Gemmataceae bacterium]
MVLFEPERTQFDLSWRMLGVPIRVHPMFWLIACLLGANWLQVWGVGGLLLWIACMFVSILVHEFGHILAGAAFGNRGQIVLYGWGGLAIGAGDVDSRWKRIIVALAGPFAGFVLLGLVWLAADLGLPHVDDGPTRRWLILAFAMLWFMNLYWNLLNLVPIWPLDGGQVSREIFTSFGERNGMRVTLVISFLLAALLAVHGIMGENGRQLLPYVPSGGYFMAILFGLLAVESLMLLQQVNAQPRNPWEDDPDAWRR